MIPTNNAFGRDLGFGHVSRNTGLRYPIADRAGTSAGIMVNLGFPPDLSVGGGMASASEPFGPGMGTTYARLARMLSEHSYNPETLIRAPVLPDRSTSTVLDLAPAKAGGRSSAANVGVSREELLNVAARLRFFVIVLEQKGGVGKSLLCSVVNETLKITATKPVHLIDADVVNRNLSRSGLTQAGDALNAGRIDFEGFLFTAAERLSAGEIGGVVIDSAAGGEAHFRPHLAELAQALRNSSPSVRLVIVRPLTTSPLVHDNILDFGENFLTADMGILLARNLGQGRTREDYEEFDGSPEYREMRRLGMVECILESAGARYSDMITGFNKSFAEIALNEPDQLGLQDRQLEIARKVFVPPVRMFLARWLFRQTTAFQAGLVKSVLSTL